MAKLKTDAIVLADMEEYVRDASDFAFEMEVLHFLKSNGFRCSHGGTYVDPVTGKSRQFDIRALYQKSHPFMPDWRIYLRLAVECKNLRESSPLLVSCVPRDTSEAFHDVIACGQLGNPPLPRVVTLPISARNSYRRPDQPVGKSCVQVGRTISGEISASDSEFHDRWAQSLSSSVALVQESAFLTHLAPGIVHANLVLPIVVVPNGRLWQVQYDASGKRISDPEPTSAVSYFVGHTISIDAPKLDYHVSHIDFMTVDGLGNVAKGFAARLGVEEFCPEDESIRALNAAIQEAGRSP